MHPLRLRFGFTTILVIFFALVALGCQQSDGPSASASQPTEARPSAEMPAGHPPMDGEEQGGHEGHGSGEPQMPSIVTHDIVVPPSVEGKWKAVTLSVRNKKDGSASELTADLGKRTAIPGTDLTIEPVAFMPSFFMGDGKITSVNNETNNPAVKVAIRKGDEVLHEGWLFSRFPDVHPFEHPDVAVVLTGQVPADE